MASKKYLFKIYRAGVYVGMLPADKITSEFEYSQDINNAGPKIDIELAMTLDDLGVDTVTEEWTDETGAAIEDENAVPILFSQEYIFNNVPIDPGSKVVVVSYYDGAVNGRTAFQGIITGLRAGYKSGTIIVTVRNYGVQLDNYIVAVAPGNAVVEQEQRSLAWPLNYNGVTSNNYFVAAGQTFQIPSDTNVSSIQIELAANASYSGDQSATMVLRVGTPDGAGEILSTVSRPITSIFTNLVPFTFPTPVPLQTGITYSWTVTIDPMPVDSALLLNFQNSNVYADGQVYKKSNITGWAATSGEDFTFRVITATGVIGNHFENADPSDMLTSLLDNYQQLGGVIRYSASSIEKTLTTIKEYDFKSATVFDAVREVLKLAPGNWYWYVDPATNLFHFHPAATTPHHTFVIGKHLEDLEIGYNLDNVRNFVDFTGGDDGSGVNLNLQTSNPDSIGRVGQWLARPTDNRVTDEDVANVINRGILSEHPRPTFQTEVRIPAAVYDIETIQPGQMVTFRGGNNLVNSLLLQIVGMNRMRHLIVLRLATNPPVAAYRLEEIRRSLDKVYTINNPDVLA